MHNIPNGTLRTPAIVLACCVAFLAATAPAARADFFHASAMSTGVQVSLSAGAGSSLDYVANSYEQKLAAIAAINEDPPYGSQVLFPTDQVHALQTPRSLGPISLSDPVTASAGQGTVSANGSLSGAGQVLNTFSSESASSSGPRSAGGDGMASFSLNAFPSKPQPRNALLTVNLISDFETNPNAAFALETAGSTLEDQHVAVAILRVDAPYSSTFVFRLFVQATTSEAGTSLDVSFLSSSNIAQPIFASDFIAGPDGSFSLDPAKRSFTVPFEVRANDTLHLHINHEAAAYIVVPEPSGFGLALGACAVLSLLCVRRAARRAAACR